MIILAPADSGTTCLFGLKDPLAEELIDKNIQKEQEKIQARLEAATCRACAHKAADAKQLADWDKPVDALLEARVVWAMPSEICAGW